MAKFQQINESFQYVMAGKTPEDRVTRAQDIVQRDGTFLVFLRMAIDPAEKITGIPEGFPPTYKYVKEMPDGVADTTARQELRRIRNFLPNGSLQVLKPWKREVMWVQLLEGVHWREAEYLTWIKDQVLLDKFESLIPIAEALGIATRINKKEPTIETPPDKKTFQCRYCNRSTNTEYNKTKHEKTCKSKPTPEPTS